MPPPIREQLEAGLGSPLAGVRLHTGAEADSLSRDMGAVAFTAGEDVFLSAEVADMTTPRGSRTLRHELTHVAQRGAGETDSDATVAVSEPASAAEREAGERSGAPHESAGGGLLPAAAGRPAATAPRAVVHRQLATGEAPEGATLAAPSATTAAPVPTPGVPGATPPATAQAPANAALAGIFEATVIVKIQAAQVVLTWPKPDPLLAHRHLGDAERAVNALVAAYAQSDPALRDKLRVVSHSLALMREALRPYFSEHRVPLSEIAEGLSAPMAMAREVVSRLH